MDAVHEPNMVASLSVELLAETTDAEEKAYLKEAQKSRYWFPSASAALIVEVQRVAAPTRKKPVSMAMFWHDCRSFLCS